VFSFVVLIFNERPNIGSLIGRIEGVLKQEPVEFEIMPVDDNSPDKTWRLIQEIAKEKSRLVDSGKDLVAHDYAKGIHIPNSKFLSQR
jgi:glycosyltransferase involved in cell wall biosynthesis